LTDLFRCYAMSIHRVLSLMTYLFWTATQNVKSMNTTNSTYRTF